MFKQTTVNGLLTNQLNTNDDNPISLDEIEKGLWLGRIINK